MQGAGTKARAKCTTTAPCLARPCSRLWRCATASWLGLRVDRLGRCSAVFVLVLTGTLPRTANFDTASYLHQCLHPTDARTPPHPFIASSRWYGIGGGSGDDGDIDRVSQTSLNACCVMYSFFRHQVRWCVDSPAPSLLPSPSPPPSSSPILRLLECLVRRECVYG
jgi:hypothetical protein